MLDLIWPKQMNSGTKMRVNCLSYIANAMPADAVATLGASAWVSMVLTPKAGIFPLRHLKS